jgi:hypothetical protein
MESRSPPRRHARSISTGGTKPALKVSHERSYPNEMAGGRGGKEGGISEE